MKTVSFLLLAGLVASCSSLKTGPSKTYDVRVPATSQAHRLQLDIPVAQDLQLQPGGSDTVAGTITTNLAELEPEIRTQHDRTTIRQKFPPNTRPPADMINRWQLQVGASPLHLRIDTGVVGGNLQLGGLHLLSLDVDGGVQTPVIAFDRPNPAAMSELKVSGGVGKLRLSGLSHARTQSLTVEGGVGAAQLDFGGTLTKTASGTVTSGVGEVDLTFPHRVPARLTIHKGVGEVQVSGFEVEGQTYRTANFDVHKPHWDLRIDVGVGAVRVKREK